MAVVIILHIMSLYYDIYIYILHIHNNWCVRSPRQGDIQEWLLRQGDIQNQKLICSQYALWFLHLYMLYTHIIYGVYLVTFYSVAHQQFVWYQSCVKAPVNSTTSIFGYIYIYIYMGGSGAADYLATVRLLVRAPSPPEPSFRVSLSETPNRSWWMCVWMCDCEAIKVKHFLIVKCFLSAVL